MYEELEMRLRAVAGGSREEKCDGCQYEEDYPCCVDCLDKLHKQAADAIEELQRQIDAWVEPERKALIKSLPRWIPVTETPPLKVGDNGYNGYLVYANGYYEVADYTTDKLDNVLYFHVNGEYEPDVTHFMPLPEPPKEETE